MGCKAARRQDAGVITPEVIQRLVGNLLDHRDAECKVKVTILQLRCETPHCLPQQVATRHFGDLKYTVAIAEEFIQRSDEHTSELQSLMRISYADFCLKNKIMYKKK